MKCILSFVLVWFTALSSHAQVNVQSVNDSVDQKALTKQYPMAVSPRDQTTTRGMAFQKLSGDYWLDLNRFLHRNGFRTDTSVSIAVTAYFQPTGRADLALYGYPQIIRSKTPGQVPALPHLSPANERTFVRLLSAYLASRPLPVTSSLIMAPFQLGTYLSLASPSARKIPHGPGVIGDLRAAAATTRPDTVKKLAFGGLQLEQIPDVVYRFTNVEEISLSRNYLTSLPARLTTLPRLQRLDLAWNRLREDSLFFTRNTHLKAITLQNNALTTVPASLRQNRRLESLWLGNNDLPNLDGRALKRLHRLNDLNLYNAQLAVLPRQIAKLRRLRVLDLYYNNFTALPKQLGRLHRLEQLAVAHNKLSALPASLGGLRHLQTLFVHHNQLSQLPATLAKLTHLAVLDIGYNGFSTVPDVLSRITSLEELDLSSNNLQELPVSLTQLTHLKKLYLRQNPFLRSQALMETSVQLIDRLEANRTEVFH